MAGVLCDACLSLLRLCETLPAFGEAAGPTGAGADAISGGADGGIDPANQPAEAMTRGTGASVPCNRTDRAVCAQGTRMSGDVGRVCHEAAIVFRDGKASNQESAQILQIEG